MAVRTPFQQAAVAPQPFKLGLIPVHNLTQIPSFLQKGYIGGTYPEALPATGNQPQTARGVLSGLLPKSK